MTVQPLQPSTYHNAATFPSEPENYFRAVVSSVTTHVEDGYHEVDSSIQIGWAGQVTSLRFYAGYQTDEDGYIFDPSTDLDNARADLQHLHDEFMAFYGAASTALSEFKVRDSGAAAA